MSLLSFTNNRIKGKINAHKLDQARALQLLNLSLSFQKCGFLTSGSKDAQKPHTYKQIMVKHLLPIAINYIIEYWN